MLRQDQDLATDDAARAPTTDIFIDEFGELVIETHLPQFVRSQVSVTVDADAIVIDAESDEASVDPARRYLLQESARAFNHRIAVPASFDMAGATAEFAAGVLRVRVPCSTIAPTRAVAVRG